MTWVTSHRTSLRRSARTIAALYLVAAVFGQTGLIGHAQGKSTDITIKPISDALGQVDSSRTELVFRLDGLDDEKNEVKEEFAITAIENKEREQSASVIRSGLIAGLFGTEFAALAPESLGTFRMGEENYLVLEGKQPLCVLADASMGNMTEGITPDSFLSELDLFSADTKLTGVLLGRRSSAASRPIATRWTKPRWSGCRANKPATRPWASWCRSTCGWRRRATIWSRCQ